jgi:hypothetical protein
MRSSSVHRTRSAALLVLAGTTSLGACSTDRASFFDARAADGGAFGRPSAYDAGALDGAFDAGSEDVGPVGPTVSIRLVHAIPNLGRVVLCRFAALQLDDISTVDVDELARDVHSGEPLVDGDLLRQGLGFGEVSEWLSVPVRGTGLLTLHRVPAPPSDDAGLPYGDAGAADAGAADASAIDAGAAEAGVADAAADAGIDDPCDPAHLEVALPLPLPDDFLATPAPVDAGLDDAGLPSADAGDAAVDPLAERGIARALSGGERLTLFASGLLLDSAQLALRADGVRRDYLAASPGDTAGADAAAREAVRTLDRQFGPRLLASPAPSAERSEVAALALAHAVPDALSSGLRACITTEGVEGRALPATDGPAVSFRERVALSRALTPAASYRVRVFPADTFAVPGQDCANTTRAPLASYERPARSLTAGATSTLLVLGLSSPEALCGAGTLSAVARAGCYGTEPPVLRAVLLDD